MICERNVSQRRESNPSSRPTPKSKAPKSGANLPQGWRPLRPRAEVVCVSPHTSEKRPSEGDLLSGVFKRG